MAGQDSVWVGQKCNPKSDVRLCGAAAHFELEGWLARSGRALSHTGCTFFFEVSFALMTVPTSD